MSSAPRSKNPALWLLIAIPVVGVTLAMITVGAAIATADAPIEITGEPLSKTSWQEQNSSAEERHTP